MFNEFTLVIDVAEGKEGFALRYVADGEELVGDLIPRFETGFEAHTYADIAACAIGAKVAAEEVQVAKTVHVAISQMAIDKYGKTDPDLKCFLQGGKNPDFRPAENPDDGFIVNPRGLLQLIVGMYRDEPTEQVHKVEEV